MKAQRSKIKIPPEGIETPLGYLYNPPGLGKQIISLVVSFFTAIFLGWVAGSIPGDISDFTKAIFYIPYILVFFFGYSAWIGWLNIIVFDTIRWSLIKTIFGYFLHKKKPSLIQEILPADEKVVEIMVRAQKATKTFFILSWPIGITGGIAVMFLKTTTSTAFLSLIVSVSTIAYGYTLSYFGRRGYLPFPDD